MTALNATAFELERTRREGRTATLAWSARNFLELSIWTEYCCTSEENAKRFRQGTSRDIFGMMAAGKKADLSPELNQRVDNARQDLERMFNAPSFKVTDEYKRIAHAATELGRDREFFSHNKFLSKMAHPTAFYVNFNTKKSFDRRLQGALFILGATFAFQSMATLIAFMLTHFPDPDGKRNLKLSLEAAGKLEAAFRELVIESGKSLRSEIFIKLIWNRTGKNVKKGRGGRQVEVAHGQPKVTIRWLRCPNRLQWKTLRTVENIDRINVAN